MDAATRVPRPWYKDFMLPPKVSHLTDPSIEKYVTVYANETPWQKSIIELMPAYVKRAQDIFGQNLPHVDFEFFRNYRQFASRYPRSWPHATGGLRETGGFVLISETNKKNQPDKNPGVVMHEYGHALCNTIYGGQYLHGIPSWLNEGIADYIAMPWYEEMFATTPDMIRQEADNYRFPSYEILIGDFFRYGCAAYGIGRLMVVEILRDHGAGAIPSLLDEAGKRNGAFEEVVYDFAGKTPYDLYMKVLTDNRISDVPPDMSESERSWMRTMQNAVYKAYWEKMVSEMEASGKTVRQYARVAGVSEKTLHEARKALVQHGQGLAPTHRDE